MPYEVKDPKHLDRNDDLEVAVPGELWYKKPYKLHRNVGVNNESAVCPTSAGRPCPICEYKAARLKEGVDYEEVKALRPSLRNLYVVIPKGMKDYEEEMHLWDISQFCFQDMLNDELAEDDDYGVFPDPEEGLTLRIRFSKEKLGKNEFAKASRIDFDERDEQYDEDALEAVPCLDEVLTVPGYKELEAKFFELEGEEESPEIEEEEEEEEKAKKPAPTRKKKKAKPEPEESEDEEEAPWEEPKEEPEEEEKAAKKKKKKNKPAAKKENKKAEERCPHGHQFGIDADEYEECDDCEIWDECIEEKEEG
jgi:hypothetical protein